MGPPDWDLALESGLLTHLLYDLGQTLLLCALTLLLRHRETEAHSPTCSSHVPVTQEGPLAQPTGRGDGLALRKVSWLSPECGASGA